MFCFFLLHYFVVKRKKGDGFIIKYKEENDHTKKRQNHKTRKKQTA